MNKSEFSCSLDFTSKLISVLSVLLAISLFKIDTISEEGTSHMGILAGLFLILVLAFCFVTAPVKYSMDRDEIRITRYIGKKTINKHNIVSIRIPNQGEMSWPIRIIGNGGLFGYTGRYRTGAIGTMIWHCSRRSNYVLIYRQGAHPLVITPDHPENFMEKCIAEGYPVS